MEVSGALFIEPMPHSESLSSVVPPSTSRRWLRYGTMVAPDGCGIGQVGKAGALGEESVERIVQHRKTLPLDVIKFVRTKQVGAEQHRAIGMPGTRQVVSVAQIAGGDGVGALPLHGCVHKSRVRVSAQVVQLFLQLAGVGPVVVSVQHGDVFASVCQNAPVELDGVADQSHVLLAADIDDARVLRRYACAYGLRTIRRGIVADIDAYGLVAHLHPCALNRLRDECLLIICRDANSYHMLLLASSLQPQT